MEERAPEPGLKNTLLLFVYCVAPPVSPEGQEAHGSFLSRSSGALLRTWSLRGPWAGFEGDNGERLPRKLIRSRRASALGPPSHPGSMPTAASGGMSFFPPHLPEAGVEEISEDDPCSRRGGSHVFSYTSTLQGFCPALVLAHQVWQLLSYAWDISLSLQAQGGCHLQKMCFCCCLLWRPADHLGHSPQCVASVACPQTQPFTDLLCCLAGLTASELAI